MPRKRKTQKEAPEAADAVLPEFEEGFLSPTLKADELKRRLQKLAQVLSADKQHDDEEKIPQHVCDTVSATKMLRHKNAEVRVLVAACLVDIMRITAPNQPFNKGTLKSVFQLFIELFSGAADNGSAYFSQSFHVLEVLSKFHICTLLVANEFETTLLNLFETIFEVAHADMNARVQFHFTEIICQCIEELGDDIPSKVIDVLLTKLVTYDKDTSEYATQMAITVLNRCHVSLETQVSSFIQHHVLVLDGDDDWDSPFAGDRKAQLEVLQQIGIAAPDLLLPSLAHLQQAIMHNDETFRADVTRAVGEMLVTENSRLQNSLLLDAFLKRCLDFHASVRGVACEYATDLVLSECDQYKSIIEIVSSRMLDKDEKVRQIATASLCKIGLQAPEKISSTDVSNIAERLQDRKADIRSDTLVGLAKMFQHHVAEYWKEGKALPEHAKKFVIIPGKLLALLDTMNSVQMQILFDIKIIPSGFSVDQRSTLLMGIYASIKNDPAPLSKFRSMIERKHTLCKNMQEILSITEDIRQASNTEKARLGEKRKAAIKQMCTRIPGLPSKAYEAIVSILDHKDKKLRRWLSTLCDTSASYADLRSVRKEFLSAVRTKGDKEQIKTLDSTWKNITAAFPMTLIGKDNVEVLLAEVIRHKDNRKRDVLTRAAMDLVVLCTNISPSSIASHFEDLLKVLATDSTRNQETVLRLMARGTFDKLTKTQLTKASRRLKEFTCDGNSKTAKFAIRSLHRLLPTSEFKTVAFDVLQNVQDLDEKSADLATTLSAISETLLYVDEVLEDEKLFEFISKFLSTPPDKTNQSKDAYLMAVKCVTNYLVTAWRLRNKTDLLSCQEQCRNILRDIVRLQSFVGDDEGTYEDLRESDAITLKSAKGILKLISVGAANTFPLTDDIYLGIVAHHDTIDVRRLFVRRLSKYLLTSSSFPRRYLALLAFSGVDPETTVKETAQSSLQALIRHCRTQVIRRQRLFPDAPHIWPEFFLGDLVFLLSRHPDFHTSNKALRYFGRILGFMITLLLADEKAANPSLISSILTTIKQRQDAFNPENTNIYVLSELAHDVLLKKANNQVWEDYPGPIYLNTRLLQPRSASAKHLGTYLPADYTAGGATRSPAKRKAKRKAKVDTPKKVSPKKAKGTPKKVSPSPSRSTRPRAVKQTQNYNEDANFKSIEKIIRSAEKEQEQPKPGSESSGDDLGAQDEHVEEVDKSMAGTSLEFDLSNDDDDASSVENKAPESKERNGSASSSVAKRKSMSPSPRKQRRAPSVTPSPTKKTKASPEPAGQNSFRATRVRRSNRR